MSIPNLSLKFQVSSLKLEDARSAFSKPNLRLQTSNLRRRKSLGLSLVELIVFIVIVGASIAGIIAVITVTTRSSADPAIHKQALAIAEAVLEEVQLQPFTYCDPDDPQAAAALSATVGASGCTAAASVEAIGAEATAPYGPETRLSVTTPFDNVNDYHGFDSNSAPSGIRNIDGTLISGLESYRVTVSVAGQALGAIGNDGNGRPQSLLITVTATAPGNTTLILHGYRTRYAPNDLP
jgi:MSHA pilin protein MshD